ncbi:hypothetical protein FALBO_8784 [Fusarium albosuccineum]|uniref:Bacteriophage T5 Orf172 DNA-binding domain-containing protein n=1 Tax=Fusarium albosuccineum TaxID=1237068 RepID=A0A8H4L7P2_9HYPO|nr:hypothetical protein FALBO_8784 [Fusarium albosuccineum]
MASNNNSDSELDSLYDALSISRTDEITCFAPRPRLKTPCTALPKKRRLQIEIKLHEILAESGNILADTGKEEPVPKLLMELASLLRCQPSRHVRFIKVEGRRTEMLSYIASRCHVALRTRYLKTTLSNENKHRDINDSEPELSTHHLTPAKAGTHISKLQPKENQDKLDDNDHSDDDLTEGTGTEWERASLQRPQLRREKPMMDETTFVTPTKQSGSSNRMPSAGFQLTEDRLTARLAAFGLMDNPWIASPDSVASPNPSDVFSTTSAASTPMSIKDDFEPDSPVHHRRQSYLKRLGEESPTRRVSFGKILDGMRELRITDEAPEVGNGSSPGRTSFNVPYMRRRNVSDGATPCGKDLKAKEPIIADAFDTGEEAESRTHKIIRVKSRLAPLQVSHTTKRPMVFLNKTKEHTVHDILEFMRESARDPSLAPGYIYCFAEKSAPGYLKIGHTRSLKIHGENSGIVLLPEEEKDEDTVKRRLKEWGQKCGHDIDYKFRVLMPCAVWKMESYIHMTLHEEKRVARCPNISCTTNHKEWFEITEIEARSTIEAWQKFSELKPYDEYGQMGKYWLSYAKKNSKQYKGLDTKRWLEGPWADETSKAIERRNEAKKLRREKIELEKLQKEEIELEKEKGKAERELARLDRQLARLDRQLAQHKIQELEKRIERLRRKQRASGVNLEG